MFKVKIQGITQQSQTFRNICTLTHVPHPSFLIKVILTEDLCRLVHSLTAVPSSRTGTNWGRQAQGVNIL